MGLLNPSATLTRLDLANLIYKLDGTGLQYLAVGNFSKEFLNQINYLKKHTGARYEPINLDLKYGDFQLDCEPQTYVALEKIYADLENVKFDSTWFKSYLWDVFAKKNTFFATVISLRPNPFHIAVNSNCMKVAAKYLEEGQDINDLNGYAGKSVLHIAADNGDQEMVKFLIEKGAKLDLLTSRKQHFYNNLPWGNGVIGTTIPPLVLPITNNDLETVEILLKAGANPNLDLPKFYKWSDYIQDVKMQELLVKYGYQS